MMRFAIGSLALMIMSTTFYSCAYIFGRKSKQITVYLERDSTTLLYNEKALSYSPFSVIAENRKKYLTFGIVHQADTFDASYRRKLRDTFYTDVLGLGLIFGSVYWYVTTEVEPNGKVFNYPRRLYVDPTAPDRRVINPWPRVRKGWTRINLGIPSITNLQIDTGRANLNLTGILGLSAGGEYYFRDNYSLWADMGYAMGGFNGESASYIDSTESYASAAYYANFGVSRHFGRLSVGMGMGASRLRYIYEVPDYLSRSKDPIRTYDIGINKFNLAFKLNYWIKPNSSINLNYMPSFPTPDGTKYTHIIYLGWTTNLPIRQPNRYRIKTDYLINTKPKTRKTAKSPQSSGNQP